MKFFRFLDLFRRSKKAEDRRQKPRASSGPASSVLIIDDSSTVVFTLRRMLQTGGYVTYEAYNAEVGLELAKEHRPDLVFLDIVLPGMNGFAALRRLRRDPNTSHIPIIMMSGNEQATEQFWAQKIGADDFMKKPFSRAEVYERIERLMGRKTSRPEGAG